MDEAFIKITVIDGQLSIECECDEENRGQAYDFAQRLLKELALGLAEGK